MNGTVKQFKDALDEMKTIYPFQDDKTYISTNNLIDHSNSCLSIATKDEKTGISIEMTKYLDFSEKSNE